MLKQVYLIRHGEVDGTAERRFVGSTDLPLNARGLAQVRRLATLLPSGLAAGGAGIWCVASPLLRAQQTATAVAGRFGLPVTTDPDLREIDFGEWEGLTSAEVEERFPGLQAGWMSPGADAAFPGGESLGSFEGRMARALDRIVQSQAEVVLVFAHGGTIRALACGLLGLGREGFWLFAVQPASVLRADVYRGGGILSELWSVADREGG